MRWLWVPLCLALVPGGQDRGVRELLPSQEASRPWVISGEPAVYQGDELYKLIDGGADVYLEFGFVRAASAEYERGRDALTCTIYEMEDPQAAFGVFSYGRSPDSHPAALGDGGVEADLRLVFWQDRYFVIVESYSPGKEIAPTLASLAAAIAHNIGRHAAAPAVLQRLPRQGLIEGSEKLLAGRLAVESLWFLEGADVFQLDEGDRVLYGEYGSSGSKMKLFLAVYRTPEKAASVHAHVRALVSPERGYSALGEQGAQMFWAKDGRYAGLGRDEDSVILVVDAASREDAAALIADVAKRP